MTALLLLSFRCIVPVNVVWLFLTVLWVGLQCVIVFLQCATLVTHHFSGPTICWNRTFSMIIYVLTFHLFDDVKKISESLMRITLLRQKQF